MNFKTFNDKLWFVYDADRYIVYTEKQGRTANRKNWRRSKTQYELFPSVKLRKLFSF